MMSEPLDAFIPVHPKDYTKLCYVIRGLREHTDVREIHVCTPEPSQLPALEGVCVHADADILPFDTSRFFMRPNWIYQQFLKLFQQVTGNWYLGMDADMILNKRLDVFEDGHPVAILTHNQDIGQYFTFNSVMVGVGKTYPYSYLSDCTLYSRALIDEMLSDNDYADRMAFIEKAVGIMSYDAYPGDAELYGSWVYHKYPELYTHRKFKAALIGRYNAAPYDSQEIESAIARHEAFDMISLHSWEGHP